VWDGVEPEAYKERSTEYLDTYYDPDTPFLLSDEVLENRYRHPRAEVMAVGAAIHVDVGQALMAVRAALNIKAVHGHDFHIELLIKDEICEENKEELTRSLTGLLNCFISRGTGQ
tara:strand:+ start:373 stop:717 length:345 start_codon:yes stop_codon:yes gene_type:complete